MPESKNMDWLFALIVSTPEYQSFGWSLVFAGFVTTVVLTFGLQLPGLINQARTIWRNRSAEGVEMLTFIGVLVVGLAYVWMKGALEW